MCPSNSTGDVACTFVSASGNIQYGTLMNAEVNKVINEDRTPQGVLRLMHESVTHGQLQHARLQHRHLIAHVVVAFQKSLNSAHAEAVCLMAITPLTARRLKWKNCCNSVESCLRLLAPPSCSVEIAVPAWACADRHNWHPDSVCRSGKLWSLPQFWILMFGVFGWRTWPEMNLSALEANVFYIGSTVANKCGYCVV